MFQLQLVETLVKVAVLGYLRPSEMLDVVAVDLRPQVFDVMLGQAWK
jgi:hypothetical protein